MTPETEVVYVCTPDRTDQLAPSLKSLFASGSTFDSVRIFCVGKRPRMWTFTDPRIIVEEVEPLDPSYFMLNKTYLTESPAERVIYVDADTVIMDSIDRIWRNSDADFLARMETAMEPSGPNADLDLHRWHDVLKRVGAEEDLPYFNSGFIIFQNGAHRRIQQKWRKFTRSGLNDDLFNPATLHRNRHFYSEQIALSLAVGATHLSYHMLDESEHAYRWSQDDHANTVVYHMGSTKHFSAVDDLIRKGAIDEWSEEPFENGAAVNLYCKLARWKDRFVAAGRKGKKWLRNVIVAR